MSRTRLLAATTQRATVGGCTLGLAVGWNHSDIGAIAETVAGDYGVSLATVGLFTAALFVVHAGSQIPAGRATDAFGARAVGLAAAGVLVAANALASVAPDPALVVVARALTGIGTALGFVAGIDYVRSQGGSPLAQGLYGGSTIGGAGLALAIVPLMDTYLGWRAPFVGAIVLAGGAAAVLATGPASVRRGRRRTHQPPMPATGGASLLRDRRLNRLCLLSMASFGFSVVLGNWVVTLLERSGGYERSVAGAIGSLILLGGIVSRPAGGLLARRFPQRNRATIIASFAASAVSTLILASQGPPALIAAGALLLGLAAGLPFAALFGAATRVRPDAPAASVAVVNMASNVFIVVCTPLLGLSFSLPGDGRIGFAAAAALWLAAASIVPNARDLEFVPKPASANLP